MTLGKCAAVVDASPCSKYEILAHGVESQEPLTLWSVQVALGGRACVWQGLCQL